LLYRSIKAIRIEAEKILGNIKKGKVIVANKYRILNNEFVLGKTILRYN
jgi:hypothetical protein